MALYNPPEALPAQAHGRPAIMLFIASWCSSCRAAEPVFTEVTSAFEGRIDASKVDVDVSARLADHFGVTSLPTFVLLKDGVALARVPGALSPHSMQSLLEALLA